MIDRRSLIAGLAFSGLASPAAAKGGVVTVLAAASLQDALNDLAEPFAQSGADMVRFSFGASSAMARQIEQGAPADLFISADSDWMNWVQERGLIVPSSRRDLLSNRLVLIAPRGSGAKLAIGPGMPLAQALGGGRLAVADPAAVPAGKYAAAALRSLGVWDGVQDKLAPAENVRAALAFVARGEAPLGIVYATDAKAEPKVEVVGVFPPKTHPPIVYPAALTARAVQPQAGRFMAFLRGGQAKAVFRRHGFIVL